MKNIASIDIGSHTARLLVAQKSGRGGHFRPLLRKRVYIRLAEGFEDQAKERIRQEAIYRTLNALEDFASITRGFDVGATYAVSTGVVRKAVNRDDFLNLIYEQTGTRLKVISGEEEAQLTEKGVLHSLNIQERPFMIFDLGGGSTEFICREKEVRMVKSIPLGTMILTQRFLATDPPEEREIEDLVEYIDGVLQEAFDRSNYSGSDDLLVGTGGTATTLAAMIRGIDIKDINPDKINGLIVKRGQIEDLFARIRTMTIDERLRLKGLDRDRAEVIIAGSMAVIRILCFFRSIQMAVSLSDLLEGILITYFQGEEDE